MWCQSEGFKYRVFKLLCPVWMGFVWYEDEFSFLNLGKDRWWLIVARKRWFVCINLIVVGLRSQKGYKEWSKLLMRILVLKFEQCLERSNHLFLCEPECWWRTLVEKKKWSSDLIPRKMAKADWNHLLSFLVLI